MSTFPKAKAAYFAYHSRRLPRPTIRTCDTTSQSKLFKLNSEGLEQNLMSLGDGIDLENAADQELTTVIDLLFPTYLNTSTKPDFRVGVRKNGFYARIRTSLIPIPYLTARHNIFFHV